MIEYTDDSQIYGFSISAGQYLKLYLYKNGVEVHRKSLQCIANGAQGYNGCVPRLFENGMVSGQTYYCNDTTVNTVNGNVVDTDGIRHIDAIAVEDDTMESGYSVYQCKRNYTATRKATTRAEFEAISGWSTYFVRVATNAANAFFAYLMAQNAYIKMLSGAMMVVLDASKKVIGGMQGNPDLPIFWAGDALPESALWQQYANGFAKYGIPNGERIELDPSGKTISFYDSSNVKVTEHSARKYSSLSSILPSDATFTVDTVQRSLTNSGFGDLTKTSTYNMSSVISVSKNGQLRVSYTRLQVYQTTGTYDSSKAKLINMPRAYVQLILCCYTTSAATVKAAGDVILASYAVFSEHDNTQYSGGYNSTAAQTVSASVTGGLYYRLVFKLINETSAVATSSATGYCKLSSATIVADFWSSMFFGNGMLLSKNTQNYFAAMLEGSYLRMIAENTYYGTDVRSDGIYAKRGSYWHKQPVTLLAMRVHASAEGTLYSYTAYNGVSFNLNSSSPSAAVGAISYSTSDHGGRFTIYYPTNWRTYGLSTKGFVQATVYDYAKNGNQGYLCYVKNITDNYVEIWTADDWSSNWGSFYIELKMF